MSECVFVSHREAVQHDTCRSLTFIVCRLAHTSNRSVSVCERELVQLRGHHYHAPPWIMLSAAPLKWALQGQQLNYFYREALILHWKCHLQASLSSTLRSALIHTWACYTAPVWTCMFTGAYWGFWSTYCILLTVIWGYFWKKSYVRQNSWSHGLVVSLIDRRSDQSFCPTNKPDWRVD